MILIGTSRTALFCSGNFPKNGITTSKGIWLFREMSELLTQRSVWHLRVKRNIWFSTKEINVPLIHKLLERLIDARRRARGCGRG